MICVGKNVHGKSAPLPPPPTKQLQREQTNKMQQQILTKNKFSPHSREIYYIKKIDIFSMDIFAYTNHGHFFHGHFPMDIFLPLSVQKPCKQAQHPKLYYYDLLQAQKEGTCDNPGLGCTIMSQTDPPTRQHLLGANWRPWHLKLKLSLSQKVVTQSGTSVHLGSKWAGTLSCNPALGSHQRAPFISELKTLAWRN